MHSMTGFGKGIIGRDNRFIEVEIKTVNHRYRDIHIRMPRMFQPLEEIMRQRCFEQIHRGKIDLYIHFRTDAPEDISFSINKTVANAYYKVLKDLSHSYQLEEPGLELLANVPDLIVAGARDLGEAAEAVNSLLLEGLDIALKELIAMRQREGQELETSMMNKNRELKKLLGQIKNRAPVVARENEKKLRTKLSLLLADELVDENRMLTEITLFADRVAIDEEIVRLDSHINQIESFMTVPDPLGRKFDFVLQEVNREINTIASKSSDLEISNLTIDMKTIAEQIREQVQNIE